MSTGTASVAGDPIVRSSSNAVDACYRQTLRNEPEARGAWSFRLVISDEGKVVELKGEPEPTVPPSLRACVTDVMTRLPFTAPGEVSVHLDFKPTP